MIHGMGISDVHSWHAEGLVGSDSEPERSGITDCCPGLCTRKG